MFRRSHPGLGQVIFSQSLLVIIFGCGNEAEFQSSPRLKVEEVAESPAPKEEAKTGDQEAAPAPKEPSVKVRDQLMWLWECENNASTDDDAADQKVKIKGKGPHYLDIAADEQLPVSISGQLCVPGAGLRDIVFVVDVSGSMNRNDPTTNGSCGRLNAIQQVVASLPADDSVQIGLVTFSTQVIDTTSGFIKPSIFNLQYANAQILCKNDVETNYQRALEQAQLIFQGPQARANAFKEIYFISDGEPRPADMHGKDQAKSLRDWTKARIATVFLHRNSNNDEDAILKNDIASRDNNDIPMHRRGNAQELAEYLKKLAAVSIVDSKLFFRGIGENKWVTKKLEFDPKNFKFQFPLDDVTLAKYPFGIEFRYEYVDEAGRTYGDEGRIIWNQK